MPASLSNDPFPFKGKVGMGPVPALIALDWGTTSLRAYLLDASGAMLDRKFEPLGILKVPDNDFDAAFEETCAAWLGDSATALPILASGMIGSRQGWLEAPYVPCPAGLDQLASKFVSLTTKKARRVVLVPGIRTENSAGVPDVIRGEETQIIGALEATRSTQLFVLPGTHSKWAVVRDHRITRFATFMTGEVFAILKEHSILGRTMKSDYDDIEAFQQGYEYAFDETANPAGLLQQLFSTRTLALFDEIPADALHAYLSGLLIGSEIRGGLELFGGNLDMIIVGEPALAHRYQRGFNFSRKHSKIADDNVTPLGLFRLAQAGGLLT
jgi:2-dehydro-3-deoxygalactonokinase